MDIVNKKLTSIFENKYSSTILITFLVLYGGMAAPKLPGFIKKLFENPVFKIIILSLVAYTGNRDPQFALMIAVAFTVTLNMISDSKVKEHFNRCWPGPKPASYHGYEGKKCCTYLMDGDVNPSTCQ